MTAQSVRTTAGGILAGLAVGTVSAQKPTLLVLAIVAGCGFLLGQRPALVLGLFLLTDQAYADSFYYQDVGPFVTTGHQLYEPVKNLSPALALLLLTLAAQLYAGRGLAARKLHTHGLDGVGAILLALIFWVAMLSLAQETMDFSLGTMPRIATNVIAAVLPWLLMLLAYAVAVPMLREPGGPARFARVAAGALLLKGVLGLASLATTQGAVIDGQANVVYYDAALPMVAAMAVIGLLLSSQRTVPWRKMLLFLCITIVAFSFRRSVWSAMVVALLVLPLIRARGVVVRRLLAGLAASLLLFAVLPGAAKEAAFGRVGSGLRVALGTGNEESAKHHKRDVERGYEIAQRNIWAGVGVRAPQRREFAYQDIDRIYVHNDPLQVWLRFGLPGITLYALLLLTLLWRGVTALRARGDLSILEAGSAAFAAVIVVPVLSAPFISETLRWPIFLGIVAAVLRVGSTRRRDEAAAASAAAVARRAPLPAPIPA